MIDEHDEYLHDVGHREWLESFSFNFIDRKSTIFGCADINYTHQNKSVAYTWFLSVRGNACLYENAAQLNDISKVKSINARGLRYRIVKPLKEFEIRLMGDSVSGDFCFSGVYPIYVYPPGHFDGWNNPLPRSIQLGDRYGQICSVTGNIRLRQSRENEVREAVTCFGEREHSYGRILKDVACKSDLTIYFRDMSIKLSYLEIDGVTVTGGFISRRSGNIPVTAVELELFSYSHERGEFRFASSEFSYRDAQDDVDLVVSERIHQVEMPLPKNLRGKFVKFRSFSNFTIIGTNKRGIGMENHFISVERIEKVNI